MRINTKKGKLLQQVREITDQCLTSQTERINRGAMFTNYAMTGSENPSDAALYNKTYAYLDDLDSLLYSPISLRFHISDPDVPNILEEAKGRSAAAKLRQFARQSDTDTKMSEAVFWALVKGKTILKQMWKRGGFAPELIQPESFGVLRENHNKLDEDMEAFTHTMLITPYQFRRLIWEHPDRAELEKKAKRYTRTERPDLAPAGAQKQVIVGGLYPFQAAGSNTPNNTRGIVDWMSGPNPMLSPSVEESLMQLDETWIWDDERADWSTFQSIGNEMMIMGRYQIINAYAYNPATKQEDPVLKGSHPFHEFSPNRLDGYFWGRSEIINVALLQEAINSRLNGINKILRKQEDPPTKFTGTTGVNQNALAKFRKPGGTWQDANPNAKIEDMTPQVPETLFLSLHELERMFDEMSGKPPTARGHGEAGVRSSAHADSLIRMASPRFKDRALLIERDVEGVEAGMLDLARVHESKKLIAWVPEGAAGLEKSAIPDPLLIPPVAGQTPVYFSFADLPEDVVCTVDSHSSSPAFSEEAKQTALLLLKTGAMGPEDLVYHLDAPDPEELVAGIQRRAAAREAAQKEQMQLKLVTSGKKS